MPVPEMVRTSAPRKVPMLDLPAQPLFIRCARDLWAQGAEDQDWERGSHQACGSAQPALHSRPSQ